MTLAVAEALGPNKPSVSPGRTICALAFFTSDFPVVMNRPSVARYYALTMVGVIGGANPTELRIPSTLMQTMVFTLPLNVSPINGCLGDSAL